MTAFDVWLRAEDWSEVTAVTSADAADTGAVVASLAPLFRVGL
jgi:hypothetical protein